MGSGQALPTNDPLLMGVCTKGLSPRKRVDCPSSGPQVPRSKGFSVTRQICFQNRPARANTMHKPITAHTPEHFAALLNTHEASGYRMHSSGVGDGVWWAVLYREEDWSYPFRMACRDEGQSELVLALVESLEAAVDPNTSQPERVKRVREKLAPLMPKKTATSGSSVGVSTTQAKTVLNGTACPPRAEEVSTSR